MRLFFNLPCTHIFGLRAYTVLLTHVAFTFLFFTIMMSFKRRFAKLLRQKKSNKRKGGFIHQFMSFQWHS